MEKIQKCDMAIIGGGIFGAAIAYYFKRDNPGSEVVLFERNTISSGSTSLAAALMSRARPYRNIIPLSLETYRVIPELTELTGINLPVKFNGTVYVASGSYSSEDLHQLLITISDYGIEWDYLTEKQATANLKWLNTSAASALAMIHNEAFTDPYLLCTLFAQASKKLGVKINQHSGVRSINISDNTITGISTGEETFLSDLTVIASGVWSVALAYELGIPLPLAPVRSQYWISETNKNIFSVGAPAVIIPGAGFYSRPQGTSLLFGLREPESFYADPRLLPDNIHDYRFSTDDGWGDLLAGYGRVAPFFNDFGSIGIRNYVAGFSGYTPDNQFVIGKVNGFDGLLIAAGCCGAGISVSGGVGLGVASIAAGRENPFDFSLFKPDRFGSIDPYSKEHLIKCGLARSGKTSG
jgi:4-methylaminobutanoate oxidase (formaldehyde-forming)